MTTKTFTKGDVTVKTAIPAEQVQLRAQGFTEKQPAKAVKKD